MQVDELVNTMLLRFSELLTLKIKGLCTFSYPKCG